MFDVQTLYSAAGAAAAALLLGGAFARTVARQTTANALAGWKETSGSQAARIATLEAERAQFRADRAEDKARIEQLEAQLGAVETRLSALQAQAAADAQTILRLTSERDQLRRKVRQLTARVADLERFHLAQAEGAAATP